MWRALLAVVLIATLGGCSSGTEGTGSADRATTSAPVSSAEPTGPPVTVSGKLDAKLLSKGMCAWVETGQGRIEVWVDDKYGQGSFFDQDDTFEGIRTINPAEPNTPGTLAFPRGAQISVTGTKYESTPECGAYGVRAVKPITAA